MLGLEGLDRAALDEAEMALLGLAGSRAERLGMRLGRQEVGFVQFDPPGRAYPAGSTSADLWFQHIAIAVSDMAEAHRRAMAAGARPITQGGPQGMPANTGGVTAFKFRDPDGHPLELLFFPAGTGAAVRHEPGVASPFLGLDHTAIAVGHTAEVQAFYEGLGLAAGERSHSRGPEQERLDDVAADRVEVVPMTLPQQPPHVELLGYEVGRGRPMPPDTWATTSGPRGSGSRWSRSPRRRWTVPQCSGTARGCCGSGIRPAMRSCWWSATVAPMSSARR